MNEPEPQVKAQSSESGERIESPRPAPLYCAECGATLPGHFDYGPHDHCSHLDKQAPKTQDVETWLSSLNNVVVDVVRKSDYDAAQRKIEVLADLVRRLVFECREHNAEYHHHTEVALLDKATAELETK